MATITIPNFIYPEVGGDRDKWGSILNENLSKQVILYNSIKTNIETLSTATTTLASDKLNVSDVDSLIYPKVDAYLVSTIEPNIDVYIDNYVATTTKADLDSYVTDTLEVELKTYSDTLKAEITTTGNTAKGSLDASITEGNSLKTELDNRIATATDKKTDLEASITTATTTKGNLDIANSTATDNISSIESNIETYNTNASSKTTIFNDNYTTKLEAITSEGDTQVTNVKNEGSTQVATVTAEGDTQVAKLSSGGYVEVTDIDTEFTLQVGYYEGVDSQGTQFSVRVDSTLEIPENSSIKDVAGYVRLQGVDLPCKLAIREYPTLTDNTAGPVLLEIESNFDDDGDTEAIKSLNINKSLILLA